MGISQIHREGSQRLHMLTKSVLEGHICKSFDRSDSNVDLAEIKVSFMMQLVAPVFELAVRDVDMTAWLFPSLYHLDLPILSSCLWQYWTLVLFPKSEH